MVSSALAIGFLIVPFVVAVSRPYLRLCVAVLAVQGVVGILGFLFHASSVARQPAATWFEKILSGAPLMAPLLFPNLVVLASVALWVLDRWMLDSSADGRASDSVGRPFSFALCLESRRIA